MDQELLIDSKVSELNEKYSDSELRQLFLENGMSNVPLTSYTKNSLMKQLARKLLNITSNIETTSEPPKAESAIVKVESNNNTDTDDLKKNLMEAKESLSFCLNEDYKTHYAVCIPGQDDSITIHSDFREVLKLMKDHKAENPRMLSFRNKAEAEAYAEQHSANEVCEGSTIKTSYPEERAEVELGEAKLFPSLTTPQLSEFRIQLEKGNVMFCRERILANPRFLIGIGDMPTILKEGPRYNAMHASVISGQLESCRLVMEMVSDVEFLKCMYQTQMRAVENSQRLTDLYLNTPDKIANKTPLHFASEKGLVDIVAFLVTFKACIRNFNKHMVVNVSRGDKHYESRSCTGKTPEELACSRYNGPNPATVKAKIINLIKEGVCYVPLIKSDTAGSYAQIGAPYTPTSPYKLVSEIEDVFRPAMYDADDSLKDIRNIKVWAFAGPMPQHEADLFRREWKSPRMKRANFREHLKITDGNRGFEHYGRELADSHDTSWQEFWPFLNQFADLRSESGLEKLETFFQKQSVIVTMQTFLTAPDDLALVDPYKTNVTYILKPAVDPSASLEGDNFISAESTVAEEFSSLSDDSLREVHNLTTEVAHQVPPVRDILDLQSKASPGILSSLWGGIAKIKDYLSNSGNRSNPSSPISQSKFFSSESTDRKQSSSDISGSQPNVHLDSSEQGDQVTSQVKDSKDLCQDGDIINQEIKVFASLDVPAQPNTSTPVRSTIKEEDDSGIPEAYNCRSYMDNSFTPKHWKYRTSRHSLDNSDKAMDRDTESPSRRSLGSGRKYHSDSEREGDSPSRRFNKLTKHHSDSQRSSPSRNSPKACNNSFNTKMDSLCKHLDKFKITSPDKSTPTLSLSAASCDMTSLKSVLIEPNLHIFTGKMFTQFTAHLSAVKGRAVGTSGFHELPIACLRQDSDLSSVLVDIFLPQEVSPGTLLSSVLDEQSQHEVVKNVWVNFLAIFPDVDSARRVCSLSSDEVLNVVIEGLTECSKVNGKNLKDIYKESRECIEDKMSVTVEMRVLRTATLPKKDVFILGSVPTKADADIFSTLNRQTFQLIREQGHRFPFCKCWLDSMDRPEKEFISSLPSPYRVLRRYERRDLFPVSPLVHNDSLLPSQMTSTPKTSRVMHQAH